MAVCGLVLSASAQDAGQAIVFSAPQSDDTQAATPSLAPRSPDLPTLPGTLMAPMSTFSSGSGLSASQLPPPAYSSEQQRQKQLQAERRNWTLMTPEEILGVTTAEKLLQPTERDAFGREKKTTQIERYIDRETSARSGLTNGWRSDRANSPWNFSRDDDDAGLPSHRLDGTADPMQNLNQFLQRQQNNNAGKPNGTLDDNALNVFTKQKEAKEKLEQQATMQRFRQMLQPSSDALANNKFFPVAKPVVDPNLTQPDFMPNPAGASFTPLSSTIGRPTGLTPLPGVVTPSSQPAPIPSWKPRPPPWVSPSGTPTAFPQQTF